MGAPLVTRAQDKPLQTLAILLRVFCLAILFYSPLPGVPARDAGTRERGEDTVHGLHLSLDLGALPLDQLYSLTLSLPTACKVFHFRIPGERTPDSPRPRVRVAPHSGFLGR